MRIYSAVEYEKPFCRDTMDGALRQLGKMLNAEVILRSHKMWGIRHIDGDAGNDVLVIVEVGNLGYRNISISELRTFYPNAKIVTLASDTLYYIKNNRFQIDHPAEVDLWLDTMSLCANEYKEIGANTDVWYWSICQPLIDELIHFKNTAYNPQKIFDVVSVLSPNTVHEEGTYRNRMFKYLEENRIKTTLGGNGQHDHNVQKTYQLYLNSWLTLGTTSSNSVQMKQSMKGYRDCLGVFLDVPLIYDNSLDVPQMCGGTVDLYDYDDFSTLKTLILNLKNDQEKYQKRIKQQQEWFSELTIEKQLYRLLKKHNLIQGGCCG